MTRTGVERHRVVIARDLMERLLRIGSPLGLFAEEFDPQTIWGTSHRRSRILR